MQGDITKKAEADLLALPNWESGLNSNCSSLMFNFSEVSYINSLGIAVLIRIVLSAHKAGCSSFAFGLIAHYKKLFRIVGLTE